ncbi:BamA/TamA family outer membrane protein [Pedobacter sp. P351]|uniref:translocation and assembly module lipoprotein TamL n=1 Tax=Pedobacter superstes TaxID=3133441 RepID=UPI00309737B3
MKAYLFVRPLFVASILFLVLFLGGCSATRYLSEDQKLVRRVSIEGIDKQFSEQANLYVQRDIMPNSRLNLALYNYFNTKKGKYRTDRIRDIGEAPNLLDSSLVEISRRELEKFLFDKSFFKAKVKSDIIVKNKKAYITFTAVPGPSFTIKNFSYVIPDAAVKQLYMESRPSFTNITEGTRYDGDSLRNESKQVFNLLQKSGFYDYKEQYVRFTVDTNLYESAANIKLFLDNPLNQTEHKVYYMNNTSFLIKNSYGKTTGTPDTLLIDSQYFFRDYSRRFEPERVLSYNYLKKGEKYDIDKKNLTYDRLFDLNVFKSVKIDYVKTSDSLSLDASIEAVPMKRLSNRVEGEYTFNSGRSGFNIGNTYTNRNVFGGAEQLDFRIRYGLLFNNAIKGNLVDQIFNRDLQFGITLTFPRLLVPFNTDKLGKNGVPHTTISSSLQIFDQLNAFKSRLFINSLTYDWVETRTKLHSFTPLNIEYRNGIFDGNFRDSLEDAGYNLYLKTNDRQYFNLGSLYTFTLNASKLLTYDNFIYFRTSTDIGGNTLNLLDKVLKSDSTFLGLRYLQYAKTDFDMRLYRSFGGERQFIARINPGIAHPYGNSTTQLPFEKNYYAGGSSGIRAWQARTLGPGNYNRDTLDSDDLRRSLINLDQFGELKMEANLEYRFKILNNFFGSKLKGAAFTDFGNVWRIRKTDNNPGGEFKFNKFFNQIAIGAGAGLRFDVEYFIFRFDVGAKIKDPQFKGSEQWVIKQIFNNEFKEEYLRTHAPDTYRFLQYNFGIGMPF